MIPIDPLARIMNLYRDGQLYIDNESVTPAAINFKNFNPKRLEDSLMPNEVIIRVSLLNSLTQD
jgi:hypothetical protein